MSVSRMAIHLPDSLLADLNRRLDATRWPDEIEGAGWSQGTDLAYMRALAAYWRQGFDWRRQEAALNALPQVRVAVDGLRIHAVHIRGRGPKPLPLVITHGWPGSFVEMVKIVPLLTDPAAHGGSADDAFDVVVPSLPGYGFSDRPGARGMNPRRIAGLWVKLMAALGYERFAAQGGDWGSAVSSALGLDHADRVLGIHLNFIVGRFLLGGSLATAREDEDTREFLGTLRAWWDSEGGYNHEQGTKPQTLGYGLNDSPVGLAAWIVEKFRTWSDCSGDVERAFTRDELLTNVMIYWATETAVSSTRLYFESREAPLSLTPDSRVNVPVAVALFPKEIPMPPRALAERGYNIKRWTAMPRGGHFAAMEQPELLAEDVKEFFRELR